MKKTSNKKIYIITRGEDSYRYIVAAFSDKKEAKKFVKEFGDNIEEIEINKFTNQYFEKTKMFTVRMKRNGDCIVKEENRFVIATQNDSANSTIRIGNFLDFQSNRGLCQILRCTLFANNEEHAVKVVNEKRLMIIANNLWPFENSECVIDFNTLILL